jgi:low affinity Fe/Cu permease
MDNALHKYKMICTLKFGDIYGQIIIWLIVIFISLATTLALWSSTRQIYALATVGIVLVLSLPFLLFAFVTTLLNRIEFVPMEEELFSRRTLVGPNNQTTNSETANAS